MFFTVGLSTEDQINIQMLESELIKTLQKSMESITEGDYYSRLWFGDCSKLWITQLKRKLGRMISILNSQLIEILYSLKNDPNLYAESITPWNGWQDYTEIPFSSDFVINVQAQDFRIDLASRWSDAPLFSNGTGIDYPDSKFEVLVHEVSHLLVGTDDIHFGKKDCHILAILDHLNAKENADNWAYFLEEYRPSKNRCIWK